MKFQKQQTDKIQWMLATKFIKLTGTGLTDAPKSSPLWDSYLDENGIGRISGAPVAPAGHIILPYLFFGMEYIFVPKDFAERALILGFLP